MKKLIVCILLLTFVFSFTACAAANQAVTDVDALEEQVNADWAKKQNVDEGTKVSSFRYYGTDNGYHIVMFNYGVTMGVVRNYKIAGYTFDNCATHFMAYKNGKFTKLNTAYLLRMVSKEAIAKAAELHESGEYEVSENTALAKAEYAFKNQYGGVRTFRCCGRENGYRIIFVQLRGASHKPSTQEIAGSSFESPYVFSMYVYKDDAFTELAQAYSDGLISKEAIAEAAKNHAEYIKTAE